MIKILRNKDFNITDFLVDDVEGVNELKNTNGCAAGSTAYVVNTGQTYIKNNNGDWIAKIIDNSNNNNNDASSEEIGELIYEFEQELTEEEPLVAEGSRGFSIGFAEIGSLGSPKKKVKIKVRLGDESYEFDTAISTYEDISCPFTSEKYGSCELIPYGILTHINEAGGSFQTTNVYVSVNLIETK